MFKELKNKLRVKLEKLEIMLEFPGAYKARKAGCYFEIYKMIYRIYSMGIKPRTILDIGAYQGMFSRCAHYIFPQAAIYAFEPLNNRYAELSKLKNIIDKFECYNVALAQKEGEAYMHRSSRDYSSSLLKMGKLHKEAFPETAGERLERVRTQTLNALLAGKELTRPVLMKVDVQGYEKYVFEGGGEILDNTDYVICEMSFRPLYKGQPLFDEVYQYLIKAGFLFRGPIAAMQNPRTHEILQIDGFFIKER